MITEKRIEIVREHTWKSRELHVAEGRNAIYDKVCLKHLDYDDRYPYYMIDDEGNTWKVFEGSIYPQHAETEVRLPKEFGRLLTLAHVFSDAVKDLPDDN